MAQPTTPWWTNLLAIFLTAVVAVYALRPRPPSEPSTFQIPTVTSFFKDTISYIPHILLLFGVLADMFTQEGVYSIPSLVGLLTIPLNWVFKYFWGGLYDLINTAKQLATTTPPTQQGGAAGDFFQQYDGCNVQGFGWAASKYAPQTLVITATVFSYYMFDLLTNRGVTSAIPTIVLFAVFYIAEMFVIGSCSTGDASEPGTLLKGVMALSEGMFFGGTSYSVVQSFFPERLPSAVLSPFPRRSRKDLKAGPNGTLVDEKGLPYVMLPNGQVTPDLSSTAGRAKFAATAAENLGTGLPPKAASCDLVTRKTPASRPVF